MALNSLMLYKHMSRHLRGLGSQHKAVSQAAVLKRHHSRLMKDLTLLHFKAAYSWSGHGSMPLRPRYGAGRCPLGQPMIAFQPMKSNRSYSFYLALMQVALPHDERIRLRLCFTERSLCLVAQPRVRLHLHIRPTAPEQDVKAAGREGMERCTALFLGEQADRSSVSGSGSDKAMPDQNSETGSGWFAPLQQVNQAAAAAGAAYETHISTVGEQQKATSALQFRTAGTENSSQDSHLECEQHEASATAAKAPAADASSNGHLLVEDASNMCGIGGGGPSEKASEPHSMTAVTDSQQNWTAIAESPLQDSTGLEASGSAPELDACKQGTNANLSALKFLDMFMSMSSSACVSPRHTHRQPAPHCSYTQAVAGLNAQPAVATHLKGATAHELSMEAMHSDEEGGDSAPELALIAGDSSASDRQPTSDRRIELRTTAVPDQELPFSGSGGAGHPSSQPADHMAGPQLLELLRQVQADPVEGNGISAKHVTAQLEVLGEGQQLPEESPVQVHLVVSAC